MRNEHQNITGARDLSQQEIDFMNESKALGEQCKDFLARLHKTNSADKSALHQAELNLKQGFMWAVRGIAKPTTF